MRRVIKICHVPLLMMYIFTKKKQINDSNLHFEKRQSTSSGKCQSTAQNISTIIKLSQSKRRKFAKANPSGCTFLHALHR